MKTVRPKQHYQREIAPDFGYWLAGLIDGEGSFNISRHRQAMFCSFHIAMRPDDAEMLIKIQKTLGFGSLYTERPRPTPGRNSNGNVRIVIQNSRGCLRLVEILERFPLQSKKRNDFVIWSEAVRLHASNLTHGSRWYKMPQKEWRDEQLLELKNKLEAQRKFGASK